MTKMKSYRLSELTIAEIEWLSQKLETTNTNIIERAISAFLTKGNSYGPIGQPRTWTTKEFRDGYHRDIS